MTKKRAQRVEKEGDDSESDDKPSRIRSLYICNDCGWRSLTASATGLPWPLVACESCSSLSVAVWPRGELEPNEVDEQ